MRIKVGRHRNGRFRVSVNGRRMPSAKPIDEWICDSFAKHKALSCMEFMATSGCEEMVGEFYEP